MPLLASRGPLTCGCVIECRLDHLLLKKSNSERRALGSVWDMVPLLCCEHNHHPHRASAHVGRSVEKNTNEPFFVEELDMEEWHFSSLVGVRWKM